MHTRQNALSQWLNKTLKYQPFSLKPLEGDASFRHYYRLKCEDKRSYIVMDAPPDKEPLAPFLDVASRLEQSQIRVPTIHAKDNQQGFLLLEDFGNKLLLSCLCDKNADRYYHAAMSVIRSIQDIPTIGLPCFDQTFMRKEIGLFQHWFLGKLLRYNLSSSDQHLLETTFTWLCHHIDAQPKVFIHRDYQSRNLMLLPEQNGTPSLGVIDFQDAMLGPFTYDLVSLLKDCYIHWPTHHRHEWLYVYYQMGLRTPMTLEAFTEAFDLCGLQRHLKVLGIFSRLYLRDNKPNYLNNLPRILDYIMNVASKFKELHEFHRFMSHTVNPIIKETQWS